MNNLISYDHRIDGVVMTKLRVIEDRRGAVMPMMRNDSLTFHEFGEIYFSLVEPDVVKAWHLHKTMTLNYACVFGMIKLVLYDPRREAPTFGMINEIIMNGYPGFEHYKMITIPPGIWNGFRVVAWDGPSIIANCATEPHDPDEIVRVHPDDFPVEYDWGDYEIAG